MAYRLKSVENQAKSIPSQVEVPRPLNCLGKPAEVSLSHQTCFFLWVGGGGGCRARFCNYASELGRRFITFLLVESHRLCNAIDISFQMWLLG